MRRIVLTALLFAMGAATAAAFMAWRDRPGAVAEPVIAMPTRTAPSPPSIPTPPPMAAQAASLPTLSLVVETTRSGPDGVQKTRQRITRSPDRVQLIVEGGRQEWLFVQNAVYRDRAAAYLTDHDRRDVRLHDESALRALMGVNGWMDVLTLRFDRRVLATLRDTGERRQAAGETFSRYVAAKPGLEGVVEVWWSEALLLPLSIKAHAAQSEVTTVVTSLSPRIDPALLASPVERFPSYKTLDPADAGDGH